MTKPFRDTLAKLRQGECEEELTKALAAVVTAVQNTGKVGVVNLKITVSPTKGLALDIEDEVTTKVPKLAQPSTLLFPTVEGNLQVNNPMQKSLDLTVVQDGGTKQLNTVGMGRPGAEGLQTVGGSATGT